MIFISLKQDNIDKEQLKTRLTEWLVIFLKCYCSKHITPYIHAFVFYLPDFIKLHGNFTLFNLELLEKLNDVSKTIFHRSSNKRKGNLKQMIHKRCKMER